MDSLNYFYLKNLPWNRILLCSILMAISLFLMRMIIGNLPFGCAYIIGGVFPFLIIRANDIKEAVILGVIISIVASVTLSFLFAWPMYLLTFKWAATSIVGILVALFISKRI